jgi:hypothetical protein
MLYLGKVAVMHAIVDDSEPGAPGSLVALSTGENLETPVKVRVEAAG